MQKYFAFAPSKIAKNFQSLHTNLIKVHEENTLVMLVKHWSQNMQKHVHSFVIELGIYGNDVGDILK